MPSIDPQTWERLTELRETHARAARRADELFRAYHDGDATREDLDEAVRLENEAYRAWHMIKTPGGEDRQPPSMRDAPRVPRDV